MGKTIGQRIKKLREEKKLTQEELAKQLGCAQTTVANWENQAGRAPGKKTVNKIAQFFNVSVDYLFGVAQFEGSTIPCYGEFPSKGFVWPEAEKYYLSKDEFSADSFALKILDDDLEPFMMKGDYGIFRKAYPKDRDIVVVRFPEENNFSVIRSWRYYKDMVALLPTNPRVSTQIQLLCVLKKKNNVIKFAQGELIIEGVLEGIKRLGMLSS